jgi:uncharacterized RDD family membrane protein YckC
MAEWYFEQEHQQSGPVDDDTFQAYIQNGTISPSTLVWKEGMTSWLPLMEINPSTQPSPASPASQIICVQCGGLFDTREAVEYGGQWICAECKPTYTQRMMETGATSSTLYPMQQTYAGFWIRFVDWFIDDIIIMIPVFILAAITGGIMSAAGVDMEDDTSPAFMLFMLVVYGAMLIIPGCYFSYFHYKKGATLGKQACGLQLINEDGSPLSLAKCVGRFFAWGLSYMICYIGLIMAGFDQEKRALHDMICGTRVVYKAKG